MGECVGANRTKPKVLVVDDDSEWRASVAVFLSDRYEVLCAGDGEEGLRVARTMKPAAVVLDVMMPGGRDGLTIFCELRKDPETWHIPVVVLSAVNEVSGLGIRVEDMRQYLGCAPEAFLDKLGTLKTLEGELRRLIEKSGAARRPSPLA